jgi:hypothetical protein
MSKPIGRDTLTAAANTADVFQIARLDDGVTWQARHGNTVLGASVKRTDALATLLAAFTTTSALVADAALGTRFVATFREEEETRDGGGFTRVMDKGSINFDRPMPLPLMATTETTWGHDGAELVGIIESGVIQNGQITMTGRFDTSERAQEIARMVEDGVLTRHSPDLGDDTTETVCTKWEEDEWGDWCVEATLHFLEATVLGTTILPFPALDSAYISIETTETSPAENTGRAEVVEIMAAANKIEPRTLTVLTASKFQPVETFPAEWFTMPKLDGPTGPVVTAEGRYYSHVAAWGTCHIGYPQGVDVCTEPPASACDYAHFHTGGTVKLDNGETVRVGHVTVGTGHASGMGVTPDQAAAHYDDTGVAAAFVRAGEDEWGPWVAGAVRPGLDDWSLWALQLSALSGDWRLFDGNLELVAALAVNVPGFPIPEPRTVMASGECVALIAAGARTMANIATKQTVNREALLAAVTDDATMARLERLEAGYARFAAVADVLQPEVIAKLSARVRR